MLKCRVCRSSLAEFICFLCGHLHDYDGFQPGSSCYFIHRSHSKFISLRLHILIITIFITLTIVSRGDWSTNYALTYEINLNVLYRYWFIHEIMDRHCHP